MRHVVIGSSRLRSARLVYGCMRIAGDGSAASRARGMAALDAAVDAGFDHFDHADIYGGGACEELFGAFLRDNPGLRESLVITGKCGIRLQGDPAPGSPKRYDSSVAHMTTAVDGSLSRLGVDHLDLLLLHRPDYLADADEVARTFDGLKQAGKVAHFGISNFRPSQVELLQSRLEEPLQVNQIEMNLNNPGVLNDGTLDQCQQYRITPQAWSPLAGAIPGTNRSRRVSEELARQAARFESEPAVLALAWILKHPAGVMPIIGSTSPERIRRSVAALDVDYDRESWYRLLEASLGHSLP